MNEAARLIQAKRAEQEQTRHRVAERARNSTTRSNTTPIAATHDTMDLHVTYEGRASVPVSLERRVPCAQQR